jgi:DNA modification methylase
VNTDSVTKIVVNYVKGVYVENKILQGDCLEVLKTLPDKSVNMCVTSPPYYGLRDYGGCGCAMRRSATMSSSTLAGGGNATPDKLKDANPDCPECEGTGRIKGMNQQIGLEETPEQYVQKLVEIFREVKRVLKDDGTLWLNLGDSYAGSHGNGCVEQSVGQKKFVKFKSPSSNVSNLKPKDLIGIPWRVAFALQDGGWYLRQDIIWHKPNPMPESVTDRCTRAHEYIFLLAKNKKYYFDNEAIKEKSISIYRSSDFIPKSKKDILGDKCSATMASSKNRSDKIINGNRNRRSVWTITTKPFSEAHFATFPEELVNPCILAGCPKDGIVMDCFMGAGTTALMALKLNRKFIGIELNPKYIEIANKRIKPFMEQRRLGE